MMRTVSKTWIKLVFALFLLISHFAFGQSVELLKKALEYAKQNEHQKAIGVYEEVLKQDPKSILALQGLGLSYLSLGQYEKGLPFFNQAFKMDRKNLTTLFALARTYVLLKQYPKAHYYYKLVLDINPYHVEAYLGKARLYRENNQHHLATETYEKILEFDPYQKEALGELSHVYLDRDQKERALKTAKKFLEINPKDVDTLSNIGSVYEAQGKIKEAIQWYEKAKTIDPKNERIQAKLSLLYGATDQIDYSLVHLQKALELQEANVKDYITLGRAYGWLYRVDEAILVFEKARAMDPKNKMVLNELASLYLYKEKWDQAENLYSQVLARSPKNTIALEGMEKVKLQKKPVFTSRFNYKTFKNKRPNDPDTESFKFEYLEELEWKLNPRHALTFLYQKNHHYQNDIENNTKDYEFNQDVASLKYNVSLSDPLLFSFRGDYNHFDNQGSNTYTIPEGDIDHFSAFSYLSFTKGAFYNFLAWKRGLLLRLLSSPNRLAEHPYYDYSNTLGLNMTPNLETIFYYAYTDYKLLKDQHDVESSLTYRLPFFKQVKLGYSFEYLSEPIERIHTASFRIQEDFFKHLLFDLLYEFKRNDNDTDQGVTHNNNVKGRLSFPLYQKLMFHFEGRWEFENGKDHDKNQEYRTYITLPFGMF
ncbi:MAG TPA: hypothetical protein DD708_05170 [Deltaproteobacteria bacterium]|nr:hypothetical protein [Deltaproteobacteria bacterium]